MVLIKKKLTAEIRSKYTIILLDIISWYKFNIAVENNIIVRIHKNILNIVFLDNWLNLSFKYPINNAENPPVNVNTKNPKLATVSEHPVCDKYCGVQSKNTFLKF